MVGLRSVLAGALIVAAGATASCSSDNLYTGGDAGGSHRFSQIGRRPPPVAAVPEEAPATVDPAAPSPMPPAQVAELPLQDSVAPSQPSRPSSLPLSEARRRVDALLDAQGFEPETGVAGDTITATRMVVAHGFPQQAECRLKALSHPQMYTTTVNVRLAPTPAGVQVGVEARFEEMDRNVVSGDLTKYPCRSLGRLEAEVRRAATGG